MHDLRHHGDRDAVPGLVDLAVNVRRAPRPDWLSAALERGFADLASYPDSTAATEAIAARHGRHPSEVLVTSGAAEAFVLLARTLNPVHAVAVHPSFTEPEAALLAAGRKVDRAIADGPAFLLPDIVDDADLVVLGNPTNPTGVLHRGVAELARPGRTLVVDEAFMDFVPGEGESLAGRSDVPGLVVVRSLTKMWGLAGLRVGYLLASAGLVRRLREHQPLWSVSTPALAAAVACSSAEAVSEGERTAAQVAVERTSFQHQLEAVPGVEVVSGATANFLLLRTKVSREDLASKGFAVRRGDTFPGLGEGWIRVRVPTIDVAGTFVEVLRRS